MSIDRFLSVKYTTWRSKIFQSKQAAFVGILIVCIIFCTNIHLTVTISYEGMENNTNPGKCFDTPMFLYWKQVSIN